MTAKRELSLQELVGKNYADFWKFKGRYRVCKGSRASKKSKTTALWFIFNIMKYPNSNALVIRKVYRTLLDSCFTELKWAASRLGVSHLWKFTTAPLRAEYIPTGQVILFRGLDDPLKLTSVTVQTGSLCWVWLEEAYELMNETDFDLVDESIRGEIDSELWKQITVTFNPWNERHWLKKRFFDVKDDNIMAKTTNYLCNEWLDEKDKQFFEDMKRRNPRRYQVAGLGDWGVVEGLIYENWQTKEFTLEQIMTAYPDLKDGFGLDFGYTIDPSAGFFGFISKSARKVFVYDELYKKGLSNRALADEIQRMGYAKDQITADSAEPKSIDELRGFGLKRIKGAKKGRDSINNGIQFIQDYEIVIHPRCVNFITEISNYTWQKDKFGKSLNTPVDDFNHLMDAMRYGLEKFITTSSPQIKTIRGGI